nr:retrotransposon protein, putative, Ty1-copia subclass [Tanacetum cinerariifolium]
MGYYFYYPPENKIVVADFLEKDFILQKESGRIVELEDEDILPFENISEHPIKGESLALIVTQEEDVIPVRRSVKTHKAPDRLCLNVEIDPDRLCFNTEVEKHNLGDLNKLANYKAALSDPEFEKWLVAMNAEMQSMYDNKVWRLVLLPPNAKVVKSKWIYKKKTDMDGKVHIYKARLVAKGCTQTYGVGYEETFSPVADIRAIRILIAIAAYYDYEIWQMNVKTEFLNGFLEEEIYMEQPEGFIDPNHPRKRDGMEKLKQSTTAQHATEAEYIAASEAVWIRKFIDELGVVPSNDYPIKMNCDNSAAIIMAKESGIQKGARHFKRKYHYVRECIKTGKINIVKVHTDHNLADLFTKALVGPKLTRHARSMGLRPTSSFM